jgi:hypothetical protein
MKDEDITPEEAGVATRTYRRRKAEVRRLG